MDLMQFGLKPVGAEAPAEDSSDAGLSRRSFIVTSLASGFALASGAIHAQAIHTDSNGLIAGEVSIPVADGKISAYRAMPAKGMNFPLILVIQEIFGVHEHIKDMCRRFAKLGYCAIAPELFARQGDVSKMTDVNAIMTNVVSKVPDAQVMSDLDSTVAYAKADTHADVNRIGIVGFCWGGRTVWLYCAHNPKVKAGVSYYGLLSGMKSPIKANDPVDIAASLTVPVLGLYAGKDHYITADIVEEMRAKLASGHSGSEVIVFPGVDHGFNADYRPTYDKIAADYAWKLAREWLKEHGV